MSSDEATESKEAVFEEELVVDRQYLLEVARLRLSTDLEVQDQGDGTYVAKHIERRHYFVCEDWQWRILEYFRKAATLPQLIPSLIEKREMPPLQHLYNLIESAVDHGILFVNDQDCSNEPVMHRLRWPMGIPMGLAIFLVMLMLGIGFAFVILGILENGWPRVPGNWEFAALGYLSVVLAASFGSILAAALTHGLKREVCNPALAFPHPFPHLEFNLKDMLFAGRQAETVEGLLVIAPVFLCFGASLKFLPEASFVLLLGLLAILAPYGRSPAWVVLRSAYGNRRPDTPVPLDKVTCRHKRGTPMGVNRMRNAVLRGVWAMVWCAVSLIVVMSIIGMEPFTTLIYPDLPDWMTLFVVALTVSMLVGTSAFLRLSLRKRLEPEAVPEPRRRPERRAASNKTPGTEELLAFAEKCALFRGFDEAARWAAVQRFEHRFHRSGQAIIDHESDDGLYLVFAGLAETYQISPRRKQLRVNDNYPGDAFGILTLPEEGDDIHYARARQDCNLLRLTGDDVETIFIPQLGEHNTAMRLQKRVFLEKIPLTAPWSVEQLDYLQERAHFVLFQAEETVIHAHMKNRNFYFVFDGELEVRGPKDRIITSLHSGEYFGEISILQDSETSASVVATRETRCLAVSKRDLLNFLARDYRIFLQFEWVASKRLRHPVYPVVDADFTGS